MLFGARCSIGCTHQSWWKLFPEAVEASVVDESGIRRERRIRYVWHWLLGHIQANSLTFSCQIFECWLCNHLTTRVVSLRWQTHFHQLIFGNSKSCYLSLLSDLTVYFIFSNLIESNTDKNKWIILNKNCYLNYLKGISVKVTDFGDSLTDLSSDTNMWVEPSVSVSLWRRPQSAANCLQNALASYFHSPSTCQPN